MFKKILVATDLSEGSRAALRTAFGLAHRLDAPVVVLHVTEPAYESRAWFSPLTERESELYRAISSREEEAARRTLDELVKEVAGGAAGAVQVTTMVLPGIPADLIPTTARELGCNLIVLGTHGRRGFRHAILGSIAERVVRLSPIPVLTVHAERPSSPAS